MTGAYNKVPPTPYRQPWVRMRCHTAVEKEDAMRAMIRMKRPTAEHIWRRKGHFWRTAKHSGDPRYIMPCNVRWEHITGNNLPLQMCQWRLFRMARSGRAHECYNNLGKLRTRRGSLVVILEGLTLAYITTHPTLMLLRRSIQRERSMPANRHRLVGGRIPSDACLISSCDVRRSAQDGVLNPARILPIQ